MGVGGKVSLKLGRLLELGRRGVWCESQSSGRAIYFFLFGSKAELTAWLLPSQAELQEAAEQVKSPPFFVIVTDQSKIARLCEERGHFVIYFNLGTLRPRAATYWLENYLRMQFAQFIPEKIFFSPQFFSRLPRPRHLGMALADMLGKFSREPSPRLLINELETNLKSALIGLYALWETGGQRGPAEVAYFGDPLYLDIPALLADRDYLRVESLGWRIGQRPPQKPIPGLVYLWFNNARMEAEARHEIMRACGSQRQKSFVTEIIGAGPRENSLSAMLEEIIRRPGVVLADTSAPLLVLLSMNAPVALLRRPCISSQIGLVKYSFFAGQERWPVLTGVGDSATQLESKTIPEWFTQWRERQTSLERTPSLDCRSKFIELYYRPLLNPVAIPTVALEN